MSSLERAHANQRGGGPEKQPRALVQHHDVALNSNITSWTGGGTDSTKQPHEKERYGKGSAKGEREAMEERKKDGGKARPLQMYPSLVLLLSCFLLVRLSPDGHLPQI